MRIGTRCFCGWRAGMGARGRCSLGRRNLAQINPAPDQSQRYAMTELLRCWNLRGTGLKLVRSRGADGGGCDSSVRAGDSGWGVCGSCAAGWALFKAVGCGDFRRYGSARMKRKSTRSGFARIDEADVDRMVEIAAGLQQAPQWPRSVYASLVLHTGPRAHCAGCRGRRKRVCCRICGCAAYPAGSGTGVDRSGRRGFSGGEWRGSCFLALAEALDGGGIAEIMLEVRAGNRGGAWVLSVPGICGGGSTEGLLC